MIPYYNIFQFLLREPMANYSRIAKAVGISDKTAKAHYQFLVEHGYIKGVQAMYFPEAIGLATQSYFVFINDFSSLELMEKLADYHNFTVFRNRFFGKKNGLFLQFNLPTDSVIYLDALFVKLKELNFIEDFYRIPVSQHKLRTYPDMQYFDNMQNTWNWAYNAWKENFQKKSSSLNDSYLKPLKTPVDVQQKLTQLDVKLLRSLTANAKKPNIVLAKELNASEVQISRRKAFLEKHVLSEYRLVYDRSKVQFVDYVLFKVKTSDSVKKQLFNYLITAPIPFDSGLELTTDGLLWRINLPPMYVSYLAEFLWQISEEFEYFVLDPLHSALYWFYDKNFDTENKTWKASKKEMYEQPLEWLKTQS